MKIAVLADIHANLVALEAVTAHLEAWHPDVVVVAGDVVNRGPRPLECLQFVRQKQQTDGWLVVRGNHEDYVLSHTRPDAPRRGPAFEVHRFSYWTFCQLDGCLDELTAMPFQQTLYTPDGAEVRVVHASMRDNRDGIYPETTDAALREKIQPPPSLLCVGHTHRPLTRRIDRTLVVNVGAVGLPFDGDRRACYAQIERRGHRWQARLVRLPYNLARAEQDFFTAGFFDGCGPLGYLILDEFRSARSRLYQWTVRYQSRVLAGEMTMQESVEDFFATYLHRPFSRR